MAWLVHGREAAILLGLPVSMSITSRLRSERRHTRTDRRQDRHADRLGLLAAVIAHDTSVFSARVERALQLATELLGFEIGLLSRIAGDLYTVSVAHAPDTDFAPGTTFDVGSTYCSLTLEAGDVVEITDAEQSAHRRHPCHTELGLKSYLGVPVCVDDEVWGTLNFSSTKPQSGALDAGDHDLLRLLALWIGSVLERETRAQELQELSGQMKAVVDQAPILMFGIDADGVFTLSEGAGLKALGLTSGEIVGQSVFDLYQDDEAVTSAIRAVLDGEAQSWEATLGEAVFTNRARPVWRENGTVAGLIGVSLDISDLSRSRRDLEASESRLQALSAATFEAIAISEGGVVVDGNDQLAELFGYDQIGDLIGKHAIDFAAPEYRSTVRAHVSVNSTDSYEVVCIRRDGSRFWAEVQGRPAPSGNAAERVTALRDITDRKQAEDQLRFQADVLAQVSDAVVALDTEGRVTYWNRGAELLHGHSADDVLGRPLAEVVTYVLPNEGIVSEAVQKALKSEAARDGHLMNVTPDGERRYLSVSASTLTDDTGEDVGVLAVSRDVTDQHKLSIQLQHQASHDALTGLYNRVLFREKIEAALHAGDPFSVFFVDLDQFKVVNDSLGHEAGDRLLRDVATRLRMTLGSIEGSVVARLGGDEFSVLVPGTDPEHVGDMVLRSLTAPFDLGLRTVSASASVGIVAHAERYSAPEVLLRDADTAMYAAKRNGRNQVAIFTEAMHEAAALRFGLEHDLRFATAHNQIVPYFQPIVDLESGVVAGFEALVRWEHPEHGLLSPARFLPLAEELGLVPDLDRWVLDLSYREVATWGAEAIDALSYLSVNCSDQTFLGPGLIDHVRDAASIAGLPMRALVLELTERALVDLDAAREVIAAARTHGLRVTIDDFGAGYSSLGLLHALPVNGVKIDRSFVTDLGASPSARAVVRAVVQLSDELGLRAVAEGVETPDQLRELRDSGAHYAQGYLFAKPVPPHEARAMLAAPPWESMWDEWTGQREASHTLL